MKFVFSFFVVLLLPILAAAQTGQSQNLPRFASLKDNQVFVRAGPGKQYPILWEFHRLGWPVELVALYNNWYKIRDLDGEEGWVYRGLISNRRTVVVKEGSPAVMFRKAEGEKAILKLEAGIALGLEKCGQTMCLVAYGKTEGWLDKTRLEPLGAE